MVPHFKRQIASGGPLTITHPDMERFMMTIPEAVQLVIQAGVKAQGGEIFVLDMGKPIKIMDLARDLICLSGLEPDKDIEIKIIGMRPGEKIGEELLTEEERTHVKKMNQMFLVPRESIDEELINRLREAFTRMPTNGNETIQILKLLLPNFPYTN